MNRRADPKANGAAVRSTEANTVRRRAIFSADHDAFRETVRRFIAREIQPFHAQWERDGIVPRALWRKAGEAGLLGCAIPEEYGGTGTDNLYNLVLVEEMARAGMTDPGARGGGISLFLVEATRAGVAKGRNLEKIGNLVQERLTQAVRSAATVEAVLEWTVAHAAKRRWFGHDHDPRPLQTPWQPHQAPLKRPPTEPETA
jgi:alkylation response protein AidB-like acyl-CoA dehydrogenase